MTWGHNYHSCFETRIRIWKCPVCTHTQRGICIFITRTYTFKPFRVSCDNQWPNRSAGELPLVPPRTKGSTVRKRPWMGRCQAGKEPPPLPEEPTPCIAQRKTETLGSSRLLNLQSFFSKFNLVFILHWHIPDLHCCVNFRCNTK